MEFEELKKKILEQIKDPKTIQELCKTLKLTDDFDVSSAVLELEIENKVAFTGFKTVYEPDGSPIFLGIYVAIQN